MLITRFKAKKKYFVFLQKQRSFMIKLPTVWIRIYF